MAKYKLIAGGHVQDDPGGKKDERTGRVVDCRFGPGDIVESKDNLAALWPEKFQPVFSEGVSGLDRQMGESARQYAKRLQVMAQQAAKDADEELTSDTLENMTDKELKAYADENEINIGTAKTRADMLKILRANAVPQMPQKIQPTSPQAVAKR